MESKRMKLQRHDNDAIRSPLSRVVRASALRICLVASIVFSLGLVAIQNGSSATAVKPTLTIGLTTAPAGNDPSKVDPDPFDETNLSLLYEPLIHQNANGTFSPGLATSWKYLGSNNQTFELTLRKNARFSDGSAVTAQAVRSWLLYFPKAKYSDAGMLGAVQSITTVGKWEVVIKLQTANPLIPIILSEAFNWGYVASPKFMAKPSFFANNADGAGPYKLVPSETIAGDQYTYVPNKYFFDKSSIHYSKIVVKVIASASSMLAALQTGQVQVAQGDPTTVTAAAKQGFNVVAKPTQTAAFVFLDLAGKQVTALGNVQVRQALNYAINRPAIATALLGKYGVPTSEYLTPDGFDPSDQNYYAYNPTKAKALLTAAGYPNGFTFSALSNSFEGTLGDPLTQAVAQDLSNIGVTMNITSETSGSAYGTAIFSGNYQAFNLEYGGDPMSIQYGYYFAPKAPFNLSGFDDPILDGYWNAAQTASQSQASSDWMKMSDETVTQALMLPVVEFDSIWYVSKHVGGVSFSDRADTPYASEWFPK